MNKNYYQLDGKSCGFALWIFGEEKFIEDNRGNRKLFKTLLLAKTYATQVLGIKNPYNYKVWIILEDEEIDFDNVEEHNGYYEYLTDTSICFIAPTRTDQVLKLGYFVFENGDQIQSDKVYGLKRGRELFKYVKEAVYEYIKFPDSETPIERITRETNGHLVIELKFTTCRLHVCYNKKIMTINQERKADGLRCLPFDKSMDKFITLYTYITKDINESNRFEAHKIAAKLQDNIIDYINEMHPEAEARYMGVNFNGVITMEGKLW